MGALKDAGWTALVVWECEIGPETLETLYQRISGAPLSC